MLTPREPGRLGLVRFMGFNVNAILNLGGWAKKQGFEGLTVNRDC
jgi:hypothetical protein